MPRVVAMSRPPVLIPHAPGTNRDTEAAVAVAAAGGDPCIEPVADLAPADFSGYAAVLLPGGFSYGDALGAGGRLALELQGWFGPNCASRAVREADPRHLQRLPGPRQVGTAGVSQLHAGRQRRRPLRVSLGHRQGRGGLPVGMARAAERFIDPLPGGAWRGTVGGGRSHCRGGTGAGGARRLPVPGLRPFRRRCRGRRRGLPGEPQRLGQRHRRDV